MSPFIHKLLAATHYNTPLFRTLVPCVGLAYALQAASAIPSIAFKTERFYDLSGSVTYLSVTALSLYLPAARARFAGFLAKSTTSSPTVMGAVKALEGKGLSCRQVVVSAAVAVWATRRMFPSQGFPSYPLSVQS